MTELLRSYAMRAADKVHLFDEPRNASVCGLVRPGWIWSGGENEVECGLCRGVKTVAGRFWEKVDRSGPGECWLWQGATSTDGYGRFRERGGRMVNAHRWAYEHLVGPIPDGLQLDHVRDRGCTSPACVNPAHLEPVTSRENTMRGDGLAARCARRTHCLHGHPFAGENLYVAPSGRRTCRACGRAR